MDETAGTSNGQGTDMDAATAAGIMTQASEHARSELTINRPLQYGYVGLLYLLAYGTVWLAVRAQHPYQGPPGWIVGILAGLVMVAVIVTAMIVNRAAGGVGGESARRRRIAFAWLAAGLAAAWGTEGGLAGAGAGVGTVDLIGASGPILVTGLVIIGVAGTWRQPPGLSVGIWLIAAAAGSALAAPATVWAIDALAGCAGFWFAAVIESRRVR